MQFKSNQLIKRSSIIYSTCLDLKHCHKKKLLDTRRNPIQTDDLNFLKFLVRFFQGFSDFILAKDFPNFKNNGLKINSIFKLPTEIVHILSTAKSTEQQLHVDFDGDWDENYRLQDLYGAPSCSTIYFKECGRLYFWPSSSRTSKRHFKTKLATFCTLINK